jgi:hypothetical protein
MSREDFIRLFREFARDELWQKARVFSKAEAWLDLLMMCKDKLGNMEIKQSELAEKWQWSIGKVSNFMMYMVDRGWVEFYAGNRHTKIHIVNWEKKQYGIDVPKKAKNIRRKELQRYEDNVLLTEKEYNQLITRYGSEITGAIIRKLDNYIENSKRGKEYTNHYKAIVNGWVAQQVLNDFGKHKNYRHGDRNKGSETGVEMLKGIVMDEEWIQKFVFKYTDSQIRAGIEAGGNEESENEKQFIANVMYHIERIGECR